MEQNNPTPESLEFRIRRRTLEMGVTILNHLSVFAPKDLWEDKDE